MAKVKLLSAEKWRLVVAALVIIVAGVLGYAVSLRDRVLVAHAGEAAAALDAKSPFDLALTALERDGDARVNILLMGKGGAGHAGGNLTDTIQLLSVDIFNNQATMMSIPRDLYVDSTVGSMKINAVYSSANSKEKNSGGQVMKQLVAEIADLTVHYFVTVDFDGFYTFIDQVGGVTVDVERTISDNQYPKEDGSNETETFYLASGSQHLDGATALKYVRSRHGAGGEGSDFARSARQQQLLAALVEEAKEDGLLRNPLQLLRLINTLSDNLQTDISTNEFKSLFKRLADFSGDQLKTVVLRNSQEGLLTDKTSLSGYTLLPIAGRGEYGAIARRFHSQTPDPLITAEAARLRVLYTNEKQEGIAADTAALLRDYGYTVTSTQLDTTQTAGTIKIYERNSTAYTTHYLTTRFGLEAVNGRGSDSETTDIDIILAQE